MRGYCVSAFVGYQGADSHMTKDAFCIYIYVYIIYIWYYFTFICLNREVWKPKWEHSSKKDKKGLPTKVTFSLQEK